MVQRESMDFDVVIVGAGPAGLSAAIKLAQLNQESSQPLTICVLEKGATVGAHLLSGAVLQPSALNELLPDWAEKNPPAHTAVTTDQFLYLSKDKSYKLPTPSPMRNHGNFIISLDEWSAWLAQQAESLGVSIFPGFPASKLLMNDDKTAVLGVQTGDQGLDKQGKPTDRFQPGINLYAKQTLFAEGCRGSLTEELIKHFHLRKNCGPQSYGIGIKELWKIKKEKHKAGSVIHTLGWPLKNDTYGGSFLYHFKDDLISLGFVIGLDYKNPYLDPFQELQRFKTHPDIRPLLEDGECIGYGARAINEGGYQAIPTLTFPGGMLIGCAAGFLNVAKIKGIHNAMKSGMLAAETIFQHQEINDASELKQYETAIRKSEICKELFQVRNLRPAFHHGLWAGLLYSALDHYIFRGKAPWTFKYKADHLSLIPAKAAEKINYPKPDGKITFDKLSQVYLSGTKHREDEPNHLHLKDNSTAIKINLTCYDSPESRYCPAAVYEIINENNKPKLQINAANCLHCKTCDIKDPTQNIVWTTPEGGDGPNYSQL